MSRLRSHLSYANVMATIAVFVALGGTSYAVASLPRDSVGSKQIRSNAVGRSEVRKGAIMTRQVRDRSIALKDISRAARDSLRGQTGRTGPQGPPGPGTLYAAALDSGGGVARRTPGVANVNKAGTALYTIRIERDLSQCYAYATLSDVPGGVTASPQNGEIVTAITGDTVTVRTRNSGGAPTDLPFHVLVSC